MKKIIITALAIFLSISLSRVDVKAECKRTAKGWVGVYFTYKEKNKNIERKDYAGVDTFQAQGRYGGGCTPSGRKKARNRAHEAVKRMIMAKYNGKGQAQKELLCQKVSQTVKQKAEWIKIDYIKAFHQTLNCSNPTVCPSPKYRIPAATHDKFICSGNRPVTFKPPPPPVSTPDTGRNELNTNRPGGDYKNFWMSPKLSCDECKKACLADPRCKAWTYVKPGIQGPKAKCWLKTRVPAKKRNNCCISGIK